LKQRLAALAAILTVAVLVAACSAPAPPPRPNILLISADTLRADHVGANGYYRDTTPTIDALAARGTNFTHAYSHAPQTAMSHTSLLTSLYPSVHGVFEHGQRPDPALITLPEALLAAGYATGAFTQLNGRTFEPGFETWHYIESELESNKGLTDLTVLTDWVGSQEKPWFAFLHSYDVHLPYAPEPEYLEMWAPDYDGPLPPNIRRRAQIDPINSGEMEVTERDLQFIVDVYDAELRRLDDIYGRLFADLEAMGELENTVIVFFSDHGEEFGEHGNWGRHSYTLHEELLRVPLIFAGPGVPEGLEIDAAVRLVDVAPTLFDMLQIEHPEHVMGEALQPVWDGTERAPRQVIAERNNERAIIHAGFKYYQDKLYDLNADPWGTVDIAAENPELVETLSLALTDWTGRFHQMASVVRKDGTIELTPEEERRLRALGYLQ
jgi:arylsulfatase A-like enzyme